MVGSDDVLIVLCLDVGNRLYGTMSSSRNGKTCVKNEVLSAWTNFRPSVIFYAALPFACLSIIVGPLLVQGGGVHSSNLQKGTPNADGTISRTIIAPCSCVLTSRHRGG